MSSIPTSVTSAASTADRFLEKLQRRLCVPLLAEQKVDGLAVFVHRTVEILPLALDFDVGLVRAPADPHWAFATMKGFSSWGLYLMTHRLMVE